MLYCFKDWGEVQVGWWLAAVLHQMGHEWAQKKLWVCVYGCGQKMEDSILYRQPLLPLQEVTRSVSPHTINHTWDTNAKSWLLYRRSSQWTSSAPRELSRINQAHNLDTFQRILLLIPQLSLRQLGPCLSWMSKNGYTEFTLMLSFYVCHLCYFIHHRYYTNVHIRCCAGQYRRP